MLEVPLKVEVLMASRTATASASALTSSDVDALFKLPLGEFTSARNALAARLKKAGDQARAHQAKALSKPSVSAWVVNQLYWRHRALFDRLLEAGDRLRQAQAAEQTRESTRELVSERRETVTALAEIAADMLRESGYSATRDVMRRVTSTLEALSTYGSAPDAPSAGRLTHDVEPPGFDTLAVLLARGGTALGRPVVRHATIPTRRAEPRENRSRRPEQQQRVAAAKDAVRNAERAHSLARKRAERAAAKLRTAAARAEAGDRQRTEIEQRLARATSEAEGAHEQLRVAEADARQASQAAESAERAVELARRQLQEAQSYRFR
jgi:hypothetical protein